MTLIFLTIILRLFSPPDTLPYGFGLYPVKVDTIQAAPINWKSNPSAKRFKTVITQGVTQGVNFAGHYRIVEWGCGSPCQSWVIVDLITGTIYDGISTANGMVFERNSYLIVLDPHDDTDFRSPNKTTLYLWKNNKLRLLK